MSEEYQIGRVKVAFAHEGVPLSDDGIKMLRDYIFGRITAKEANGL